MSETEHTDEHAESSAEPNNDAKPQSDLDRFRAELPQLAEAVKQRHLARQRQRRRLGLVR